MRLPWFLPPKFAYSKILYYLCTRKLTLGCLHDISEWGSRHILWRLLTLVFDLLECRKFQTWLLKTSSGRCPWVFIRPHVPKCVCGFVYTQRGFLHCLFVTKGNSYNLKRRISKKRDPRFIFRLFFLTLFILKTIAFAIDFWANIKVKAIYDFYYYL